eukprot:scaffold25867_cov55-Attheya_sp.AAC.3
MRNIPFGQISKCGATLLAISFVADQVSAHTTLIDWFQDGCPVVTFYGALCSSEFQPRMSLGRVIPFKEAMEIKHVQPAIIDGDIGLPRFGI